jgi:hypothetical protein
MEQNDTPTLDANIIEQLTRESDRLLMLYTDTQNGIQTVFNFYLTFVTAIVGGLIVIFQAGNLEADARDLIICGLLFFAVIASTVYLSAISGRYAHAGRYAQAIDDLRRVLLRPVAHYLPLNYDTFMSNPGRQLHGRAAWSYWLLPTGTYQMFISLASGIALAVMILVLASSGGALGRGLPAAVLVALLTSIIFNVYSRLVMRRFTGRVNIYVGDDSPAWATRL